MFPSSDTLKAIISSLVARTAEQDPPTRHTKESFLLRPGPSRSLASLNLDVLRLIALELYRTPRALKPLASCSRALRNIASPILFSRCRRPIDQLYPPDTIHPFARHFIYAGGHAGAALEYFEELLDSFSLLTSIAFEHMKGPSWSILRVCLSNPRIASISFDRQAELTSADGFPIEELSKISISLSSFSYNVQLWRGLRSRMDRHNYKGDLLPTMIAHESHCLSNLVLAMNRTLTRLSLPMESAPILKMARVSWPNLQELTIDGVYLTSEQVDSLPVLLAALPCLQKLSVRIGRGSTSNGGRPPILGQHTTPRSVLSGMRSLTVAYPNPDDDIFVVDTSHLRHLSICDWPRHYNTLAYQRLYSPPYCYPILSSSECLTILRRMDLPELLSLELVYLADHAGADDELLQYVAETFPELSHLELHRYRADRKEEVDYIHIARLLTSARSLRTVRLNLDLHGDHGPYCNDGDARKAWWKIFRDTLGWEIVDVMQDCPLLGRVELLYHCMPTATWVEFHPARCGEPRFVLTYDKDHREPDLMPYSWCDYFAFGPWSEYQP